MKSRNELDKVLLEIVENVYFQPPENLKLKYPCITYERDQIQSVHANNFPYKKNVAYSLTYIRKDPDDEVTLFKINNLEMCRHERTYTKDNLNHDIFKIYI